MAWSDFDVKIQLLAGNVFAPFKPRRLSRSFYIAPLHLVCAAFLMPIATSPSTAPRPFKMEERKRPAITNADDLAPPSKRQNVNGAGKSRDDSGDAKDEAWIEVSVTRPSRPPPPDP